jgi:hypothetical protein
LAGFNQTKVFTEKVGNAKPIAALTQHEISMFYEGQHRFQNKVADLATKAYDHEKRGSWL